MFAATARIQTVEAVAIGHEGLLRLYDNRHWSHIWIAIETLAAGFFASNVEDAPLIYGQLEAHHPAWGGDPGSNVAPRRCGGSASNPMPTF